MLTFILFLACASADPQDAETPPATQAEQVAIEEAAEPATEEAAPETEEATGNAAILAKADAADGVEDKVVSKCSMCSLGMEGDPSHTTTHEGYELHFCSKSCKKSFEKDPDKGLAALN